MAVEDIEAVVRSWTMSGTSELYPGVIPSELKRGARRLGKSLPDELTALYELCDGGSILSGNIGLLPHDGEDLSLLLASAYLRKYRWKVPLEVLVFGNNGSGSWFGLWLANDKGSRPLVVEIGEVFERDSLAIVGTSLSGFLRGRSAYYLLMYACPSSALDVINLSLNFRRKTANEQDSDAFFEELMRWANPDLPNLPLSPYKARLTAEDVRQLAEAAR